MKKNAAPSAPAAAPAPATTAADRRTRQRVARLLFERGPQTAADLGAALGLTPAGVRRHLDAMVAGGVLSERAPRVFGRRGRGRPARLFALTEAGRAGMPNGYDGLAVQALRFLADTAGDEAVADFARQRVAALADRYDEELASLPVASRPAALAAALSRDGYAARSEHAGTGVQICQHHCPVQHAAEQFPQLCDAETQVFAELLGVHVQRLATIAHGDGVCTTHVPLNQLPTPTAPAPRRTRA